MTLDLTRRGVLAGMGAASAMSVAGPALASTRPGAIDVHGHALPDFYRRSLRAHGVRRVSGLPVPNWSPERAVRFMDSHRIAAQVLSLPDPGVGYLRSATARVAMARRTNDFLAGLILSKRPAHRGRFGALATLPLRTGSLDEQLAALTEARRALDLGLDGVTLYARYGSIYLGDATLSPLMSGLDALGATVVAHPTAAGIRPRTGLPPAMLDAPFHTTRALVQLSYHGVFTAYPRIRWMFTDAGGTLPYLAYRTSLLQVTPALAQNLGISLEDLDERNLDFGRLLYDTAWAPSPAAMEATKQVAGPGHVLFGTDWPLSSASLPTTGKAQPTLGDVYVDDELRAVERRNALRVFPELAARMAR